MTDAHENNIPTTEISTVSTAIDQPVPVHNGDQMAHALDAYLDLQSKLDAKLGAEAIVSINGKQFRTKLYWRTISRAFGLSVGEVPKSEERLESGSGDWGYKVTYRAETKTGTFADGDGACMSSEKFGGSGTLHNVRSHAHTRAFNRAVSNLCGFGEVSEEEVSGYRATDAQKVQPVAQPPNAFLNAPQGAVPKATTPYQAPPPPTDEEPAVAHTFTGKLQDQMYGDNLKAAHEVFEGPNGAWTLYVLRFDNGESGGTFEKELYDYGVSCYQRDVTVEATLVPKKKKNPMDRQSWNVQKISEIQDTLDAPASTPTPAPELEVDDIPF